MDKLAKKYKLFIIITLVLVVVGMTLFGIFGFNNTVDFKDSYEVKVSIEQSVEDAKTTLKTSADEYLNSKDIKAVDYCAQQLDNGKTLVYKFDKDVNIDDADMKNFIQTKFDNSNLVGITVNAEYAFVRGNNPFNVGAVVLAVGIALVIAFLFMLIMEKLSGAVAMISTSVISAIAFISLLAIVRLPAEPVVAISIATAMVLSAVLSSTTVAKCSEKYKIASAQSKPNAFTVAEEVMASENMKYLVTAIIILVASVAISAFIVPYLMFAGIQLLLAGLVALAVSYFGCPLMWALIKGGKKSK